MERGLNPGFLIDIKGLGLDYCRLEEGVLQIGATATLSSLLTNPIVKKRAIPLWEAIDVMASVQVRNRATIGGNLCNAAPSADIFPPLSVLEAELVIANDDCVRKISVDEFCYGPGKTTLKKGEILTEILIPEMEENSAGAYCKYLRTAEDIAISGVAAWFKLDTDNNCQHVRITLGAVGPTPLRAIAAESFLLGKEVCETNILQAAEIASNEAKPIDDVRSTAQYRKELIRVLTARALRTALSRCSNNIQGGLE